MNNKKKIIIISASIIGLLILLLLLYYLAAFLMNRQNSKALGARYFVQNQVLTSLSQAEKADTSKPTVVLFHAPYCRTCHQFMPFFNQLSKDYAKNYNFMALNIQDPENYPLVIGNAGAIPSLYIFDTEIGNKVHISISSIRSYAELTAELDRYKRIRSFIDLDKAKAEHEKLMAANEKIVKKEMAK